MEDIGVIERIAGSVVVAGSMRGTQMNELVRVGEAGLIGEVIRLEGNTATVQVYEETTGIRPGEKVERLRKPLSVELGPGMVGQTYDGIQRPLDVIRKIAGDFVSRGISVDALDRKKKWKFLPKAKKGQKLLGCDVLGTVQETILVTQKIMVPPNLSGTLKMIEPEGEYTVTDKISELDTENGAVPLYLMHSWPVRRPRPIKRKVSSDTLLVTGQRIIDCYFPMAIGGVAAIPGGFGTGKTIMEHQLAQWAHTDIVVYVGCGERGNEIAEVLERFPQLKDPRSGEPLMNRTIVVANTSNMPIAAREASIYTGITMAEYFRDMGYDVALMADSTSRWAEALREVSGRLEEMPGEEAYPAYLASRLANFYERAGRAEVACGENRIGSVSVVGAVSPPGADFSEPVTQDTLRITKVFWALSSPLAQRRHFPAIDWLTSYSLYLDSLEENMKKQLGRDWAELRREGMALLQRDEELREIVMLVGPDALSESQRAILEAARMMKEDFFMQHAYHPVDSYCPPAKTYHMMSLIMKFYDRMRTAVEKGVALQSILDLSAKEEIARLKIRPNEGFGQYAEELSQNIDSQFEELNVKLQRAGGA